MADRDGPDDLLVAAAAALRATPVANDDLLGAAAAALRDVTAAPSAEVATTRVRVMASLERRGHGRRRRVVVAAVLATIGTGTLSWAAATGRVQRVLAEISRPAPATFDPAPAAPVVAVAPARRGHPAPATTPAPTAPTPGAARLAPITETQLAPPPVAATTAPTSILVPDAPGTAPSLPAEVAPPRPAPLARPARRAPEPRAVDAAPAPTVDDPVDGELYLRAHAAHFRGGDPTAALAAWDAYLAERPAGRFAIEARYNRALVLVRLDRRADARDALTPFAAGAVAPAGYRQHEARALLDALARTESP